MGPMYLLDPTRFGGKLSKLDYLKAELSNRWVQAYKKSQSPCLSWSNISLREQHDVEKVFLSREKDMKGR